MPCRCGREVEVPSLGELRRMGGASGSVSPRLVIAAMVERGELPAMDDCAGCGAETKAIVDVFAICERPRVQGTSMATRIALGILMGGFGVLISIMGGESRAIGTDRDARLPIRLCQECHRRLTRFPTWPFVLVAIFPVAGGIALGVLVSSMLILVLSVIAGVVFVSFGMAWSQARHTASIRRLLRCEPAYIRLIDQFPNAEFVVLPRERPMHGPL